MAYTRNTIYETDQLSSILRYSFFTFHDVKTYKPVKDKYIIVKVGDEDRVEEVRSLVVHKFFESAFDEYGDLARKLIEWIDTDFGQWCMKNSKTIPVCSSRQEFANSEFAISITLSGIALTEYLLKYGKN